MKLYDEVIKQIEEQLKERPVKQLNILDLKRQWPEADNGNVILRSEMAYELGGKDKAALSTLLMTTNKALANEDQILLYGPDLNEINQDSAYARITIVRVKDKSLGEGNRLYNEIRKIEYVKYQINPEGYMTRISASNKSEPVRVGKEALKEGLNFAAVGEIMLRAYHQNPNIEAVKLIFITESDFAYEQLEKVILKGEQITLSIDHILKNLVMDCNTCHIKKICDEVEGMKALHFGSIHEA